MNSFIHQAKQRLSERESLLIDRLYRIKTDLYHQKQAVDPDFEEQAQECENDEVLGALMSEVENEIESIRFAFKRLDESAYEKCRLCGHPIPRQRLEAIPTASLCIDCSEIEALTS